DHWQEDRRLEAQVACGVGEAQPAAEERRGPDLPRRRQDQLLDRQPGLAHQGAGHAGKQHPLPPPGHCGPLPGQGPNRQSRTEKNEMSINAADLMRLAYETAQKIKNGKLDPEGGMAIAALVGRSTEIMRTVNDYMRLNGDATIITKGGDVFIGTETPKALTGPDPRR